jgi:hypothetical protein
MTEPAAGVIGEASRAIELKRRFYVGAGVFVVALAVAGFFPSLIDQSGRNSSPSLIVIAHGFAAALWLLLFISQATLVAQGRVAVHRRWGRIGPFLAIIIIVLGYLMVIEGARRGYDLSGDLARALTPPDAPPLGPTDLAAGILPPLTGFVTFGLLVGSGLWFRHRSEIHKRLMLLALVPLASEPLIHLVGYLASHWPNLRGGALFLLPLQLLLLFASAIHDKVTSGRIHPVSLLVPFLFLGWLALLNVVVFPSAAWRELALRLVQ